MHTCKKIAEINEGNNRQPSVGNLLKVLSISALVPESIAVAKILLPSHFAISLYQFYNEQDAMRCKWHTG